jgi:hypothetical protein
VVETAKDALAKLAELTDLGHAEVVLRDLFGKVIDAVGWIAGELPILPRAL